MQDILKNVVSRHDVTQIEVVSSNIDFVRYDQVEQILQIEFKGGKRYNYKAVTKEVMEDLTLAPSVGSFVNTNIKPKFKCEKTEINLFTKDF